MSEQLSSNRWSGEVAGKGHFELEYFYPLPEQAQAALPSFVAAVEELLAPSTPSTPATATAATTLTVVLNDATINVSSESAEGLVREIQKFAANGAGA